MPLSVYIAKLILDMRARYEAKPHRCESCRKMIQPGDRYPHTLNRVCNVECDGNYERERAL